MLRIRATLSTLLLLVGVVLLTSPANAQAALPANFSDETIVSGLALPTTFDFAADGRIFIAEKNGTVRVLKNGQLLPTPFITLNNINTFGDRGLIGLVLDPNFSSNGWVYLSYTYENDPSNESGEKTGQIVRVQADGDVADLSTFEVLVGSETGSPAQPSCDDLPSGADCIYSNSSSHSVGGLRFGPDGKLYAELGDGAGFTGVDPTAYLAQDIDILAGKILRLNPDGSVPTDNPFYAGPNANRSKVYSYGHRNSYRFDFRPTTGALYAGDVGWGSWEEVNVIPAGGNVAWPCKEGSEVQHSYVCSPSGPGPEILPMHEYSRLVTAAAVVGGSFSGNAYPAQYRDNYIYGDFHRSQIIRMVVDSNDNFVSQDVWIDGTADGPVAILTGPDGSIYYLAIFTGELRKIEYQGGGGGNEDPTAVIDAAPSSGTAPLDVSFDGSGSSDPEGEDLTFSWDFGDGNTSTLEAPSHTYDTPDTYTVTLTVQDESGNFDSAQEIIVVSGSGGTPGEPDPVHVSTTLSTTTPVVGSQVDIEALIRNRSGGGTDPFILDFEIYDQATGNRVDDDALTMSIPGGGQDSETITWIPQENGSYRISIGLFSVDWSELYEWVNAAATVDVTDRLPGGGSSGGGSSGGGSSSGGGTNEPFELQHEETVSTPNPVEPDTLVASKATVANVGKAGMGNVIIAVTNSGGTTIHEEVFDNVAFDDEEEQDITTSWTPTSEGTYYVDTGLFSGDWGTMFEWAWRAETVVVEDGAGGSSSGGGSSGGGSSGGGSSGGGSSGGGSSGGGVSLYDEGLGSGVNNWSWDSNVDLGNAEIPAASGVQITKITFTSPWAGFYLNTDPISVTGLSTLNLALNGGSSAGQGLQVVAFGAGGAVTGSAALPTLTSSWNDVTIPLSSLGLSSGTIEGIAIQGSTGSTEATFYADNIRFE